MITAFPAGLSFCLDGPGGMRGETKISLALGYSQTKQGGGKGYLLNAAVAQDVSARDGHGEGAAWEFGVVCLGWSYVGLLLSAAGGTSSL